jgi:hypothetical protein
MKFPRIHVFVDSNCPALLSGKVSAWVAPSRLVAMLSPKSTQFSPAGASSASALRWWRAERELRTPEVQIIIEGELMSGLMLGLGDYIRDIYYLADQEAICQIEAFERIHLQHCTFLRSVIKAEEAFDSLYTALSEKDPNHEGLDTSASVEIAAELDLSESPSIPNVLAELADRCAADLSKLACKERKAA